MQDDKNSSARESVQNAEDGIVEQNDIEPAKSATSPATKNWRARLETEEAIRIVYLVFGFCSIVLVMVLLQFSTDAICCGDMDGYYHIRWSALLWENFSHFRGLPTFTWLPMTVLNARDYADHHFLFHLLQIPFLWVFGPVMAAKVSSVVYGSLAVFSVYWLMYRYGIDHLLIWLFALLTSANPFLYRMNMAKAPPLTIIYSVIGVYLLFERRYKWLLPLMVVFVWTYSLFPLLFVAAIIWAAIIALNEKRLEWQPVVYTFAGMLIGNLVNPYFPNNLYLFYEHLITKLPAKYEVAVGGEWYPYSGWQLLTHLTVALIVMLIGYVLFRPRNGKLPSKAAFLMAFGTLLLIWMFRSKRLAEYFPPFAVLFGAFSWQAFKAPQGPELPSEFRRDIEPLLDVEGKTPAMGPAQIIKDYAPWAVGVLVVIWFIINIGGTRLGLKQEDLIASIKLSQGDDKYVEAAQWAKANIPAGERIFNCNWDDFPKLFYLDTTHSYVSGLDPNYLYSNDPELSRLIGEITSGKTDDPGPLIRRKFGSRWVFSDAKENVEFLAKLLESGWAETVYEDGEAYILKIRDRKGEPPTPDTVEPAASRVPDEADAQNTEDPDSDDVETDPSSVDRQPVDDDEAPTATAGQDGES